ncbi:MAG: RCC1 domain-containing protein [Candidatus Marinimicrobia bacterium]|nr:RCC1 domain-containing protein [Candidatus Neomarinimicrobiota bacterium]
MSAERVILLNITAIALGGEHSIALATDGIMYTWGKRF